MRASGRAIDERTTQPEGAVESGGGVRALERGLQLIRCFDTEHPSWRIADLARAVGLHKATARRLVKTLESEAFFVLDPDSGEYRLGSALMPVAYLVSSHRQIVQIAHPHLEQLAAQTEETVGLSVWTDGGIVSVEHVPTIHFFKPALLLGNVSTTYGTTHSKIFLAFGPEERLSKLSFGDRGHTLTLAEAARVQEELQQVRESGIAYDLEERSKGVCAVGVPLRDSTGEVVASIAVVAPPDRFGPAQKESISALIRETGMAISGELGFR
ncbi:MAG: IclR family transcriptional regulator [Actinobacteria bacterium]|nr:IclR family transcriptional regulator [Actinomycetota bacterium]